MLALLATYTTASLRQLRAGAGAAAGTEPPTRPPPPRPPPTPRRPADSGGHRLFYPALPVVAEHAPHRAVYVGDAEGRCEILAWDRSTGTAAAGDRPRGRHDPAAIDPTGTTIWWFDDDLGGVGTWRTCGFDRPDRSVAALPSVPPARHAGIAMATDGTTAIGLSNNGGRPCSCAPATAG